MYQSIIFKDFTNAEVELFIEWMSNYGETSFTSWLENRGHKKEFILSKPEYKDDKVIFEGLINDYGKET